MPAAWREDLGVLQVGVLVHAAQACAPRWREWWVCLSRPVALAVGRAIDRLAGRSHNSGSASGHTPWQLVARQAFMPPYLPRGTPCARNTRNLRPAHRCRTQSVLCAAVCALLALLVGRHVLKDAPQRHKFARRNGAPEC